MKKSFLLAACLLFLSYYLSAQNILMSDGSITRSITQSDDCAQDSGNADGTYSIIENYSLADYAEQNGVESPINMQLPTSYITPGDDGTATAIVTGGQDFHNFNKHTLRPQISRTATSLYAGIFLLTVTDSSFFKKIGGVEVFLPLQLSASTSQDSASCFGAANGSAFVSVSGGVLPYRYQWSDGSTGQSLENVPAGSYTVTITDATDCPIIESAVILSPPPIIVDVIDVEDAFCFNGADGAATVSASQGTPPYNYVWNDPSNQIGVTATGLTAGNYIISVTDVDGCTGVGTVTVGEGDAINIQSSTTEATCSNSPDGTATVNASGGKGGPYTYLWNDSAAQTDSIATGLVPGTYVVAVTDIENCTTNASIVIQSAIVINLAMSTTTTSCLNVNDGAAAVVATGNSSNYQYQWNDPLMQNTSMIFNLVPGMYTVTVTDDLNCEAVDSIEVTSPNALNIVSATVTPVSCFGLNDGLAELVVTGGTGTPTFLWSDPLMQFANPAISLFAGTYFVTVTDASGCEAYDSVVVAQPDLLELDIADVDVLCYDEATGSATLTVNGGVTPYTYAWSNMDTTTMITELIDSSYSVIVTDANGCQQDTFVLITEPMSPITTTIGQNLVGCFNANQGVAEVIATGGTGTNYIYEWSSGATTSVANNLDASMHIVTITDENGCEAYDSIMIQEFDEIIGNIITIQPSCFGSADGQVGINIVSGGVGSGNISDYTYEWSTTPMQTGDFIQNLSGATTYTVTITDVDGCTGTANILLENPPLIIANPTITNVSCKGARDGAITVNPISLDTTYTYQWGANANNQTSQTAIDLVAGAYAVTITSSKNCVIDTVIVITEPDSLLLNLTPTINLCQEDSMATITPAITGGTGPYAYQWSNGQTTASATGLINGVYTVNIIDFNGCTIIDSAEIETITPLWADVSADSVQCFGDANGSITIEPMDGIAPFSYSLDGINYGGTSTFVGLTADDYSVFVKDVNECVWESSRTVKGPEEFMVFAEADSLFMELGDSVRLFSSWENGRGFVEMFWSAPYEGTLSCVCAAPWVDPDFTTDYELYGIDEFGCEDTDQIRVIVEKPRGVFVPTGFTPNDDNVNDELFVFGRTGTKVITFRIYDRWGERVFETTDYLITDQSKAWNGQFRSKDLPAGIYQWIAEVEFLDGITEVFQGHTTLIR